MYPVVDVVVVVVVGTEVVVVVVVVPEVEVVVVVVGEKVFFLFPLEASARERNRSV